MRVHAQLTRIQRMTWWALEANNAAPAEPQQTRFPMPQTAISAMAS
jgi:hypothetical protein